MGLGNWGYSYDATEDDNFAVLMDMCGYYGVTPEEIEYLREIGYTYDDIEAYLTDPAAFGEELVFEEM